MMDYGRFRLLRRTALARRIWAREKAIPVINGLDRLWAPA
jgi:hypothetical protein